jgi:UrcA family protein
MEFAESSANSQFGIDPLCSTMKERIVRTMIDANGLACFLAAAIWVALASGCTARPASSAYSDAGKVTLRFGDLDLSNPQGATALYRRIRLAAEQVCSPFDGQDVASKIHMEICVHRAVADAEATVNRPALFPAYYVHNRPPPAIAPGTAHRTTS